MKHAYLFAFPFITLASFSKETAAQWQQVGSFTNAYSIVAHNGALFAGSQGGPIQRSTDHGDTWTTANAGITESSHWWLASEQGVLLCGTQLGAAFRSTDDGANWENIGLTSGARGFVEHNDTLYASQWYGGGVDYSTDGGATWLDTQSPAGFTGLWPMISIGGDLLVGGQSGGVRRITHSTDAWTASNTGLGSAEVYSFTRMGDVLFVGTGNNFGGSGGVYRSDDFGATWSASGVANQIVYALHAVDTLLFAGTANAGVFVSADTGATWTAFNDGLTSQQVVRLTSDNAYLYVGTLGGGVFRYGITVGIEEPYAQDMGVSAYPVPCTDRLTVSVRLNASAEVRAQLLDATGRTVAFSGSGPLPSGANTFTWDTAALAPGVYLCHVVADGVASSVRAVRE